ncbi:UNVERIFIED_CONTAM: hypothetical protein Sradi_3186400 [Sesamum radiatum]|uniref:DUF4218 domain-containing protein n=1 Tax=Sesamum radiatum TaxID=300843 RepID=A0AAW2RFL8_SESRA
MCMSSEFMFLTMVIPGLSNLKYLVDVYLELLIDELLQLWHVGVRTYNNATDKAFIMRVALMWTVNNLPAFGIASGWSTTGNIMGCLICMDDTHAFHLQHGRKKLISVALHEMLLEHVWNALMEVGLLFLSIYSTTLDVTKLHELEHSVAAIMYNLEKIFPPSFFDTMEHLIVHLP